MRRRHCRRVPGRLTTVLPRWLRFRTHALPYGSRQLRAAEICCHDHERGADRSGKRSMAPMSVAMPTLSFRASSSYRLRRRPDQGRGQPRHFRDRYSRQAGTQWLDVADRTVLSGALLCTGSHRVNICNELRFPELLDRTIQKEVGITPLAYLNRIRMQHAAHSLAHSRAPIHEIAESAL